MALFNREITGKTAPFVGNRFVTDDALGELYTKLALAADPADI
jgi:hypothetical protein